MNCVTYLYLLKKPLCWYKWKICDWKANYTSGTRHQMPQLSVDYSSKMIATLNASVEKRLSHYMDDESLAIASMLDPRFKLRWSEAEKVDHFVSVLKDKVLSVQEIESVAEQVPETSPKRQHNDFFSFLPATPTRKRNPSGVISAGVQVDEYIAGLCIDNEENPLVFCLNNSERLPQLAYLAQKNLHIMATSAPDERLFSVAGKTFRPDRCRLKDSAFETLMMIKCNSNI